MNVIFRFFRDRRLWLITIAAFLLLIIVFDKNNMIDAWRLRQEIVKLEMQRDYYLERIREDSTLLENLKNDSVLEQYAREQYLMKRDGETIFIVK